MNSPIVAVCTLPSSNRSVPKVAGHQSARRLTTLVLAVVVFSLPCRLQAQSDDFNDGNDNGWTHYDPLGGFAGAPQATYTFVNGTYRIRATKNPALPAQVGPARAGSVREDVTYTDFYVAVDLVNWDDTVRQAFGILARIGTPGLGTTVGYAFTYERGSGVTMTSGDTDISKITGEAPSGVPTGASAIHLDPAKDYRFVFIGKGPNLEGRIYELPNVTTPVLAISGMDSTYTSGFCGLVVYDNSGSSGPINPDATFDNYLALPEEPPPLFITRPNLFGEVTVSWPASFAGFTLQSSPVLPAAQWTDLAAGLEGDRFVWTDDASTGSKYFRLKKP